MANAVQTYGLTKTFNGVPAVDHIDLAIPEGAIYGFIGPNGSGKSTTMKMLLGLTQPTSGEIECFGRPLNAATRPDLLTMIGSMIEAPPGYGHLTGLENMRIIQTMLGLTGEQIQWALDIVRLTNQQDKLVKNYSLGMKQRLGIAMALARHPRLLILDEPTNGLDPAGIEEIRELLKVLAGQGITIMVSSHLLDEIEKIADVLGVLNRGALLFQGSRAQLMAQTTTQVVIECDAPDQVLAAFPTATRVGDQVIMPQCGRDQVADLITHLATHGVRVFEVKREQPRLEDVFIGLTGRGGLV